MWKKVPKKPLTVEELAQRYKEGQVCLDFALLYLLQHCRPEQVTVPLVKALQKAIESANLGKWDVTVPLEGGAMTVRQVVDEYGLEAFVQPQPHQGETIP